MNIDEAMGRLFGSLGPGDEVRIRREDDHAFTLSVRIDGELLVQRRTNNLGSGLCDAARACADRRSPPAKAPEPGPLPRPQDPCPPQQPDVGSPLDDGWADEETQAM